MMKEEVNPYGLDALTEFVKTILFSAYVKNANSLSAIIIGLPGTGKTMSLMRFQGVRGVRIVNDLTTYGLVNELIPEIMNGNIKHIIIPDFLKILSRKDKTVNELISALNVLSEEGLKEVKTFFIKVTLPFPIRCGFITSVTIDVFQLLKRRWRMIGFASRIMPFFLGYSEDDIERGKESIRKGENRFQPIKLNLPDEPIDVEIPDVLIDLIGDIANFVKQKLYDEVGFRTEKNLITFAKAHALLRGDTKVTRDDILFIESLIPFWYDPIYGSDVEYYILLNLPATYKELVDRLSEYGYSEVTIYRHLRKLMDRGLVIRSDGYWTTTLPI